MSVFSDQLTTLMGKYDVKDLMAASIYSIDHRSTSDNYFTLSDPERETRKKNILNGSPMYVQYMGAFNNLQLGLTTIGSNVILLASPMTAPNAIFTIVDTLPKVLDAIDFLSLNKIPGMDALIISLNALMTPINTAINLIQTINSAIAPIPGVNKLKLPVPSVPVKKADGTYSISATIPEIPTDTSATTTTTGTGQSTGLYSFGAESITIDPFKYIPYTSSGMFATSGHNHDTRYYLRSQVDALIAAISVSGSSSAVDWINVLNKPTTVSGYGITDAYTKGQVDSIVSGIVISGGSSSAVEWTNVLNKPTTVSGYGITDVYIKVDSDTRYILNSTSGQFATSGHTHSAYIPYSSSGLFATSGHNHDGRYISSAYQNSYVPLSGDSTVSGSVTIDATSSASYSLYLKQTLDGNTEPLYIDVPVACTEYFSSAGGTYTSGFTTPYGNFLNLRRLLPTSPTIANQYVGIGFQTKYGATNQNTYFGMKSKTGSAVIGDFVWGGRVNIGSSTSVAEFMRLSQEYRGRASALYLYSPAYGTSVALYSGLNYGWVGTFNSLDRMEIGSASYTNIQITSGHNIKISNDTISTEATTPLELNVSACSQYYSNAAKNVEFKVENTATASSTANAIQRIKTSSTGGDARTIYEVGGPAVTVMGVDQSDSDSFKIAMNANGDFDTGVMFTIASAGDILTTGSLNSDTFVYSPMLLQKKQTLTISSLSATWDGALGGQAYADYSSASGTVTITCTGLQQGGLYGLRIKQGATGRSTTFSKTATTFRQVGGGGATVTAGGNNTYDHIWVYVHTATEYELRADKNLS